jgi:hypothetical protein
MIGNVQAGRNAIFDALAANATLCALIGGDENPRIYQEIAEQSDPAPYVIIRLIPYEDDPKTANARVIFSRPIFDVFGAVEIRNFEVANAIGVEINNSVEGLRIVFGDNYVMGAEKVRQIQGQEINNGITYAKDGVRYRLTIQ